MSEDSAPLSDAERAELEELRAEKAKREQEEANRRERAELERLRAEKRRAQQARSQQARPQQARPQQERPRQAAPADGHATSQASPQGQQRARISREEAEAMARDAERRERGRQLMEPDDDLRMPKGQKIVLATLILIAVVFVLITVFGQG